MIAKPGPGSMFGSLKETTLWRFTRGVKRRLVPPTQHAPLTAPDCRFSMTAIDSPTVLQADQHYPWRLRVENQGGHPWPITGTDPVTLIYRWLSYQGEPYGPATPLPLPATLYPGEPVELTLEVRAPEFVGDYHLEVQPAQQVGGPFAERNPDSRPLRVAVPVQGQRATDIDYHEVYRNANLADNHWWVVGQYPTREQYERSSRERLGMLVQHGLTPESRVLDIGCGTGQMGDALEPYLTDRGAYYGTDIGREAIEFCQKRFSRPNFVFRQGGMTSVPFTGADGLFDLAIFFSVFTHTFLDESALLLAEARRLLAPGGCILADVITSELVERAAGHRGEMIVNRDHFLRLTAMLNLDAEIIGRWQWNPRAERLMLLLRRR